MHMRIGPLTAVAVVAALCGPVVAAVGGGPDAPGPGTPGTCGRRGDRSTADADRISDQYVVATLRCNISCRGFEPEVVTETGTFRPRDHGLHPGDGSDGTSAPWGSFTSTFEAWSRFTCLEAASDRCGTLAAVVWAKVVEVRSGDWVLDHRIECPTPREVRRIERHGREPGVVYAGYRAVLSPFEPTSGAVTSVAATDPPRLELPFPELGAVLTGPTGDPTLRNVDTFEYWADRAVTFGEVPDDITTPRRIRRYLLRAAGVGSKREFVAEKQREHGIPPRRSCAHVTRGRACFGDCLTSPDGASIVQFMGTNQVGHENLGTFAVCGDPLVEFLGAHEMSDDARDAYCEKFVADSLVAGKARAFTCSSYRIRVDCSAFD
jgi:hypothetical protein